MQLIRTFETSLAIYLDYWVEYRGIGSTIQVMVNPNTKPMFENLLKSAEIKYTKTIEDVGVLFKNQILQNQKGRIGGDFDYGKYHVIDLTQKNLKVRKKERSYSEFNFMHLSL